MLELTIDSLDGLDSNLHSFYDKTDDGYMLKVNGIDGLKSALAKEKEGKKEAKARLTELERMREEDEQKLLESQGKFKELSESEKNRRLESEGKFNELQKEVATSKRDLMLRELASSLTGDTLEQEIIARFATDYVKIEGKEVSYTTELEELKKDLAKFVRSKANDAGDRGNGDTTGATKTMTRDQFNGLDSEKRMKFIKDGGKTI